MRILKHPDPFLYKVCRPDFVIGDRQLAEMFSLMKETGGDGLAANQVGIDARLFITSWGEIFVNPTVRRLGGLEREREGCLSLSVTVEVYRSRLIVLSDGRRYTGSQARVIQHELDHLDGILITDYR